MNERHDPTIRIKVDVSNPGQFFACCGLLELAELIYRCDLLCWFDEEGFSVSQLDRAGDPFSLRDLIAQISELHLTQLDPEDHGASPLNILGSRILRLDWWKDSKSGGQALKTWAGSQNGFRIALAMQKAIPKSDVKECLDVSMVVYDSADPVKKVEPFYFDARRGARPFSRDIGFAPDALQMTTPAFPAVEFLCLVGLQRCRPRPRGEGRVFDYFTWRIPLPLSVLPVAASGLLPSVAAQGYQFENAFRTDQRKHKAFSSAIPLSRRRT